MVFEGGGKVNDVPLISCIMPTIGARKQFVAQSIKYFQAQLYPHKELILVVDEDDTLVGEVVPAQENICYTTISSERQLTTGMKRNIAVSLAQGEIICTWDDDDYFGPERLTRQVAPLLRDSAVVTALKMSLMLDAQTGTVWAPSEDIHRTLFPHTVRASTLMYQASYWHVGVQYANTRRGEDSQLLDNLLTHGATLARIVDPASYICVRHGSNTTSDIDGVAPPGWTQVPLEDYIPQEHLAFYERLRKDYEQGLYMTPEGLKTPSEYVKWHNEHLEEINQSRLERGLSPDKPLKLLGGWIKEAV